MTQQWICPAGHRWNPEPGQDQALSSVCPVCGILAVTAQPTLPYAAPEEALTLPPASTADGLLVERPVVPGYEILEILGRGGMGVVYKARQQGLNRLVALKMILAGTHADEADRERFRSEAEAVACLQHPNIVQIFEVGHAQGLPYFSLEFVAGGSLEKHLAATPLLPQDAACLVETLARAVHHAHEKGIVHRDLKPANVLLAPSEGSEASSRAAVPKITDFGLAKKLGESTGPTASGAILGTPSYMAPEQAAGKTREIGPAADIYALGAILYECLTGRPPFRAATPLDTVLQILSDEPVRPALLQSKLPRDLETVCLKCLEKQPANRYASAKELADDLRRFLDGDPVMAHRPGPVARVVRWLAKQQRGVRLASTVAALTVLLLILGLFGWRWHHESRLGRLFLSTDAQTGLTAEVLDEEGVYPVRRVGLPMTDPLRLPAGSYRLRLSSLGQLSETVQLLVEGGQQHVFALKSVDRSPRSFKTPEGTGNVWPVANLRGDGKTFLVCTLPTGTQTMRVIETREDGQVRMSWCPGKELIARPVGGGPPLWTYWSEGTTEVFGPPLLCAADGKGILLVRFVRGDGHQIDAVDASTGRRLWHFSCAADSGDRSEPPRPLEVVREDERLLVVCPTGDRYRVRDVRTGAEAAPDLVLAAHVKHRCPSAFASLGKGNKAVALLFREGFDAALSALELSTRKERWRKQGDYLAAANTDQWMGSFFGLKPGGVLAANLTGDGSPTIVLAALRQEGGEVSAVVEALDGLNGAEHWRHPLTKRLHKLSVHSLQLCDGPDLDGDGWRDVFVAALFERELFVDALSGRDGRVLWWKRCPLFQDSHRGTLLPLSLGTPCWWGEGAGRQARLVVPVFLLRTQGVADLMETGLRRLMGKMFQTGEPPEAQLFVLAADTGSLNGLVREAGQPSVADLDEDGLPELFWTQQGKCRVLAGTPPEAWRRLPPSRGVPGSLFYQEGGWKPAADLNGDGVPDLIRDGPGRSVAISGRTGELLTLSREPKVQEANDATWTRSGSTVHILSNPTRKPLWRCDGLGQPEAVLMPDRAGEPPRVLYRLADKTLVCLVALPADANGRYRLPDAEVHTYPVPPTDQRRERSLPWRPGALEAIDLLRWEAKTDAGLIDGLTRPAALPYYLVLLSLLFGLVYWWVPFVLARRAWRARSLLLALLLPIWFGLLLWYIPMVPFFGENRLGFWNDAKTMVFSVPDWVKAVFLHGGYGLLGLAGLSLLSGSRWLGQSLRQGHWRPVAWFLCGWIILTLVWGTLLLRKDASHRAGWEHYAWGDLFLLPVLWLYLLGPLPALVKWLQGLFMNRRLGERNRWTRNSDFRAPHTEP